MKHFTLTLMAAAAFCSQAFGQAQTRIKNLYTTNKTLDVVQLQSENPVQVNRILFAGYNTLCLPMTMNAEQLTASAKDIQVERLAGMEQEGSTLYLYFQDCTKEGIEAGVPYLVFSPTFQTLRALNTKAEAVSQELQNVTLTDADGNQVTFGSSWESLRVSGRYGIPAQQDAYVLESILVRTEEDKTFLPTRCGFTWDSQALGATRLEIKHVMSYEPGTRSIATTVQDDGPVDIYDTNGKLLFKQIRRADGLSRLPQGLYVIGGEKVAVKK